MLLRRIPPTRFDQDDHAHPTPPTKYRAFAPVRLTDRTWPDAVLTRRRSGAASTCATATRR
jgi:hypothetical protein